MLLPLANVPAYYARRRPHALAVSQAGQSITWSDLEERANRRARQFRDQGAAEGDFITIGAENRIELFEATFAAWKIGATPNPISPRLPLEELLPILELVRPPFIVGSLSAPGFRTVPFEADLTPFAPAPLEERVSRYWKAMTSGGSTGRPKVIVDHQPAIFDTEKPYLQQVPETAIVNPGPLYHNAPFQSAHNALAAGCLVANMARFDAEETLSLLDQTRATWVNMVPTMMRRIMNLPAETKAKYDLSSLKYVWHMGAPMPPHLKMAWIDWLGPERIWELYAGTERQVRTIISGSEWLNHQGSVGRPVAPGEIKIINSSGVECPPGEVGEVFLRSGGANGVSTYHYLGAEPLRREGGWESIGDLGWLDKEGYLYLSDRRTDLIIRGGVNIYPAEVEAALEQHPLIQSAVVIGLPDAEFGCRVHAIIQVDENEGQITRGDIARFLAQKIVVYKRPETFELTFDPLRSEAGKVRRKDLRTEREARLAAGDRSWLLSLPRSSESMIS